MNVLVVLAGQNDININQFILEHNIEYIVAVDGGFNHLASEKIKPNILIGDLDSINSQVSNIKTIKYDTNKYETDFELALNYIKQTFEKSKIYVIGFFSNKRLEHFMANIIKIEENIEFHAKYNKISMLNPGKHEVYSTKKYFSLIAKEDISSLTLNNFKYEVTNVELRKTDIYGISNELSEIGIIEFNEGKLLIFESIE